MVGHVSANSPPTAKRRVGATTEGCDLQREGRPEPFAQQRKSPKGHTAPGTVKMGESNKLDNQLEVKRLVL